MTLFSDVDRNPEDVHLRAVAVAMRVRHSGGRHAREAMRVTQEAIVKRAVRAGARELTVAGRIDKRNHPSNNLCAEFGFEYIRDVDDVLEAWVWGPLDLVHPDV